MVRCSNGFAILLGRAFYQKKNGEYFLYYLMIGKLCLLTKKYIFYNEKLPSNLILD